MVIKMEITLAEFKEQYLPELREQFYSAVQKSIVENKQEITEKLEKQVKSFLHIMGTFQNAVSIELGEMQIALLYSSVCMGEPQICISAYGQDKLLGEEILHIKYRCDWLFSEWETYQKNIERKIQEIHAERYIRKAAVKLMMNQSIMFLIYSLYAIMKYQFMEFDRFEEYDNLILTEDFRVTVGGYRDWHRTLYQRREPIDIFMREQENPLTYCTFHGAVYHKKKFSKLNLSHARFYECEFVHCEFDDVILQDCIFENCRIYHCTFHETAFYGATFRNSILKMNQLDKTYWSYEVEQQPEDLFKEVEFIECENDGTFSEGESK